MAAVTIREWIDGRRHPVPPALRRRLAAGGRASADALLAAAEEEAQRCAAGSRRDREAAFGLLAADAYITYACLWTVLNDGGSDALKRIAGRVADAAWRE